MKAAGLCARLTCEDWRDLSASFMAPLYQVEVDLWASTLEWDSSRDWLEVERGRALRTVSGLVVTDERGGIVGWTYYLVHGRTLQIGSFVSRSEACTELMFEQIFGDSQMAGVETVTFFALTTAPGLIPATRQRGLMVSRYWYLSRSGDAGVRSVPPRDARPWRVEDVEATADLLARAYGPSDGSRPFAPHGALDEWRTYVEQIAAARGCGDLLLGASWCVPAGIGRLGAVALVSRVGPSTGHLVQLAVDPQLQEKGMGSGLLEAGCQSAARLGCRHVTLLVAGQNRRARDLYEGAGFTSVASFVSAGTLQLAGQPRRLTSVAPVERLTTFR